MCTKSRRMSVRGVFLFLLASTAFATQAYSEPTVRLPGWVMKDSQGDVVGPVTVQTNGEIQFHLWDAARATPVPMNLRKSGSGAAFLEATDAFTYYTVAGCTGTVYIPAPSVGRALAATLGTNYTAAKSPATSDILLYRGEGAGSLPTVASRWQNGECVNDASVFQSALVTTTQVLNISSTMPLPWSIEGDGDIPLSMNEAGDVGIGTLTPVEKVHVLETANANTLLTVENANTGASAAGVLRSKSNGAILNFQSHGTGRTISRFGQTLGSWNEMLSVSGNGLILGTLSTKPLILGTNSANRVTIDSTGRVGIGQTAPAHPLHMASGAHVTAGGAWTNGSSRASKFDVHTLGAEDALKAVSSLTPVTFRYKREADETYVGFIAEDVPDLVASGDRTSLSPMDVVAVLTKVVQEQSKLIDELNERVKTLEGRGE